MPERNVKWIKFPYCLNLGKYFGAYVKRTLLPYLGMSYVLGEPVVRMIYRLLKIIPL